MGHRASRTPTGGPRIPSCTSARRPDNVPRRSQEEVNSRGRDVPAARRHPGRSATGRHRPPGRADPVQAVPPREAATGRRSTRRLRPPTRSRGRDPEADRAAGRTGRAEDCHPSAPRAVMLRNAHVVQARIRDYVRPPTSSGPGPATPSLRASNPEWTEAMLAVTAKVTPARNGGRRVANMSRCSTTRPALVTPAVRRCAALDRRIPLSAGCPHRPHHRDEPRATTSTSASSTSPRPSRSLPATASTSTARSRGGRLRARGRRSSTDADDLPTCGAGLSSYGTHGP